MVTSIDGMASRTTAESITKCFLGKFHREIRKPCVHEGCGGSSDGPLLR